MAQRIHLAISCCLLSVATNDPVGGLKKRPITACLQAGVRQGADTRKSAARWQSPALGGNCASGLQAASVCADVYMHWLHCGRLCAYRRQASISQLRAGCVRHSCCAVAQAAPVLLEFASSRGNGC